MAPVAATGAGNVNGANSASASSLAVTKPANTVTGDVLWALAYFRNSSATLTAPAGWTWAKQDGGNGTLGFAVKPITNAAGEPASYTFSTDGGANRCVVALGRITGADLTTPIDAVGAISAFTGTTSLVLPSVTAATDGCLLLAVESNNSSSGTVSTFTFDPAMSGTTQQNVNTGTNTSNIQLAQQGLATAGATGTRTPTMSPAAANSGGFLVTIKSGIVTTPVTDSDSGAGTEGTPTLTTTVPASDTATLTEVSGISATTADSDAGTVTDTGTVAELGVPTFTFAIDWNDDGTFTGLGDDITGDVLAKSAFTCEFGRDQARALAPPRAGDAAFSLNNLSRAYSPENMLSPLAGDILPARAFQATVDLDGVTRTLYYGHLDDFQVRVERNNYVVDATALDALANLKGAKVSTQLYGGIRTGTAIGYLLDALGWPADKRDLDPGATIIRWWWLNDNDAYDALVDLVGSEGPGAMVHASETGAVVFRDRHHRLLNTASNTTQATLTDGLGGYEPAFSSMTYDHGWRDIVNSVDFSVQERDPADLQSVYDEESQVRSIIAHGTVTVDVQTNDPVMRPEVAFTTLTGSATATVTQTAAQALTVTVTAGASGVALTGLVVSAQSVTSQRTYQVTHSDPASVDKYGARSPTASINVPWAGVQDADAIAQLIIGARAERLPTVTVELHGIGNDTRLVQQLDRDLSDRVHLTESQTGLDQDFFLEQIRHRVDGGGVLTTDFGFEQAAVQAVDVFRFDDPAHGFDDGVFGSSGLDDPASIFIFDQPGRGFDDGVFAT